MPALVPLGAPMPELVPLGAPMPELVPLNVLVSASAANNKAATTTPLTTDFKMFGGATTYERLNQMFGNAAPWGWMRDFVPETGDLCAFMPSNLEVFNDKALVQGLIAVHKRLLPDMSDVDYEKYANFEDDAARLLESVQYCAGAYSRFETCGVCRSNEESEFVESCTGIDSQKSIRGRSLLRLEKMG